MLSLFQDAQVSYLEQIISDQYLAVPCRLFSFPLSRAAQSTSCPGYITDISQTRESHHMGQERGIRRRRGSYNNTLHE